MQLEQAAHRARLSTRSRRRARDARKARAAAGAASRAGHQALGRALDLEQAGGAIALAVVDGRGQVRDFVGQAVRRGL